MKNLQSILIIVSSLIIPFLMNDDSLSMLFTNTLYLIFNKIIKLLNHDTLKIQILVSSLVIY